MKPSILVVMLDFLVCSLLLFVIGTGGKETRVATSAPAPAVHEEFSPAAIQAQQDEWNRDYEQQQLLTQLNTQTSENEQLRSRLEQTTTTLSQREQTIQKLSVEKAKVEQDKQQVEQSLSSVSTQLARVNEERVQLEKEGKATKESLAKLQVEQTKLQQQETELRQRAQKLDQTVASQAATINSLTAGVMASQARMEQQFGDFARDQQQMVSTLQQLDEFAKTLPATIQGSVAGVRQDQQAMQNNLAALTESVQGLQAGLGTDEKSDLMGLVTEVAKGQQKLQSDLDSMMRDGQANGIAASLNNIQAGQDALRQQTAKLAEQIESIKARGPGPYQAVKSARLELQVEILKQYAEDRTTSRFKGAAYPPAVRVDSKVFVVASYQSLGFAWGALAADSPSPGTVTELKYMASRKGEPSWSSPLTMPACVLKAEPRVAAVPLESVPQGLTTLELAAPGAAYQAGGQNKLHIFKSTVAGLSFEVETTPEMTDSRYLTVRRALRGVAAWFENPAYRPDTGDYMVTTDGKLVGIMISRDKCFLLGKDDFQSCGLTIPLKDKQQFQRAIEQYPKVR